MNGNFKCNSTEITFVGNIDKYLARCKKTNRRLNIIRISSFLGILVGIFLCRITFVIGPTIGIISVLVHYISIQFSLTCDLDLLEKVKDNKFIGIELKKSIETKENHCNLTLYTEDVNGNIKPVTVPSVRVLKSTNPKYQNAIEINLDKTFEITHYFYDELPCDTVLNERF